MKIEGIRPSDTSIEPDLTSVIACNGIDARRGATVVQIETNWIFKPFTRMEYVANQISILLLQYLEYCLTPLDATGVDGDGEST